MEQRLTPVRIDSTGLAPAPLKWGGRVRRNRKEGVAFWTRSQTQRPRDEIKIVNHDWWTSSAVQPELFEVLMYLGLSIFFEREPNSGPALE